MLKANLRNVFAAWILLSVMVCTAAGKTIYVNPGESIQEAIDDANDGDIIEVRPGVYFERINFAGKAIRVSSSGGPTVTTIDANEAITVARCGNGEGPNTVLEGFTLTGGDCGMWISNSSPTVINCMFVGNSSLSVGGGMYNVKSNPILVNCFFAGNKAAVAGGGMYNDDSDPVLVNCIFSGNKPRGMDNFSSSPVLTNCTFSGNSASSGGAMRSWTYSKPTLTNCILWGDSGGEIAQGFYSTTRVNCSDVKGGESGIHSDGTCSVIWEENIDTDPFFVDANGVDNIIGTADDDLRLTLGSPCIDAGDSTAVPADTADLDGDGNTAERTPMDLDGFGRFVDYPPSGGTGVSEPPLYPYVDMGAYEFSCAPIGDFDGQCDVDFVDFAILADYWQQEGPFVDIAPPPGGDDTVDERDLAILCENWLTGTVAE